MIPFQNLPDTGHLPAELQRLLEHILVQDMVGDVLDEALRLPDVGLDLLEDLVDLLLGLDEVLERRGGAGRAAEVDTVPLRRGEGR